MKLLKYYLSLISSAVGIGCVFREMALAEDGEIGAFSELVILILSAILALWISPDINKAFEEEDELDAK